MGMHRCMAMPIKYAAAHEKGEAGGDGRKGRRARVLGLDRLHDMVGFLVPREEGKGRRTWAVSTWRASTTQ